MTHLIWNNAAIVDIFNLLCALRVFGEEFRTTIMSSHLITKIKMNCVIFCSKATKNIRYMTEKINMRQY